VTGLLEHTATRMVARAKDLYTDIEELAQTRAGRIRLVAQENFHLLGKRTMLRAREDMKLRGEKIHLG
jgi:hypothetical protein